MHHGLAIGGELDVALDGEIAAIAACAAPGMFSMMPRAASCRPRWATGRAVSQSGATHASQETSNTPRPRPPHPRAARRRRRWCGHGGPCRRRRDHQVGGAVQHFRPVEEIRRGIDEAAEPDHADHLVEIAEGGLDLRQQIDAQALRAA
jgi:hypothetical protein